MSDAHDLHVLNDLAAAVRHTEGAPEEAAVELERQAHSLGADPAGGGRSVLEAAREALGGLAGGARSEAGADSGGRAQRLTALLTRMENALRDDRLSGPSRDAVLRAFDPVKAARDAALQQAG